MKLFTFQALLICFPSVLCTKYCAHIDFNPEDIFNTDNKRYGVALGMNYKKTKSDDTYCYVSFHSNSMPEEMNVRTIYDCSQHFKGHVKAGAYEGTVPEQLKKDRCYYQHNWVICVCNINYCNSPQYWPLMLARFSHDSPAKVRENSRSHEAAKGVMKALQLTVKDVNTKKGNGDYREQLRCLIWLADTLAQEEENPRFYFYNYITLLHRAPPLADALTTPPVEKQKSDSEGSELVEKYIYTFEKEPFEDGRHETDRDYRTFPFEIEQDQKNKDIANILIIAGSVLFTVTFFITLYFLHSLCRRLQNHSLFTRAEDQKAYNRFNRCFKSPQLPKEFVRRRNIKKKNTDSEAGASQK
ncbi:unnamed protein product [Caenorhabditis brenneri]